MRFGTSSEGKNKTINYEGEEAYKLSPPMELYSAVCTASLQPKFYALNVSEELQRLRTLIAKNEPEFVAKLAIYAREQMYLRSVPLVLAVELARIHSGNNLVSKLTERVIQRADELTEILSYYEQANEREGIKTLNKLSKQISKGVAEAFHKFDEYQFSKYNRDSNIKIRDAMFLCHPKPIDDVEKDLFKKIVDNTLETPYTWETELSDLGQRKFENDETKKEVVAKKWEELIDSERLGYMALIRNLRNILNANASVDHCIKVAKVLSDPQQVRKSRQLPFRFLSAYRILSGDKLPSRLSYELTTKSEGINNPHVPLILDALEDAVKTSAENVEGYDYDTNVLIASDVSGSMCHTISPKSSILYYDIGLLLSMILQNRCKLVTTGIFGDIWRVKQLPHSNILQNVESLYNMEGEVGYSTNGYKVIDHLIENDITDLDKIMIFTDCQMWNSDPIDRGWGDIAGNTMKDSWSKYKKINPNVKLYLFDLSGYGNTPLYVDNNDVFLIAGWSSNIFSVLNALDQGKDAMSIISDIVI